MSLHTLLLPNASLTAPSGELHVEGDEAMHAARVKRIRVGELVRVLDGRGGVAIARVDSAARELRLAITEHTHVEPVRPAVEVCTATPKGQRLEEMIDQLSQVGAASWRAMDTALGVVDPGEHKLERSARIAAEAAKQCGRAWLMTIEPKIAFSAALSPSGPGGITLIADGRGGPVPPIASGRVRLLVGPEGGFTKGEFDAAIAAGATPISLGPHVLRIETAAAVATALVLAAARR